MADATDPDPYDATVDWDGYWRGVDDDDRAAAFHVAGRVEGLWTPPPNASGRWSTGRHAVGLG